MLASFLELLSREIREHRVQLAAFVYLVDDFMIQHFCATRMLLGRSRWSSSRRSRDVPVAPQTCR
jgi:hypothetical protein